MKIPVIISQVMEQSTITETQTVEKDDIASILIYLCFSETDLGSLTQDGTLCNSNSFQPLTFVILNAEKVLGSPVPNARRVEQNTYGKLSFSRIIALLMPALLAIWMDLKYNIFKSILSKCCFQNAAPSLIFVITFLKPIQ